MSRDQRFYLLDGNITICVCNTLFKVHRSVLCQDGSAFENMISVCGTQDDGPREGDSDDNPIYLQGDSLDEFRDLLWSLYALPHEICTMVSPLADVIKLANIARMAHKYHFELIEPWALSTLTQRLQTKDSTWTHFLIHITEIAALCDDPELLKIVRTMWADLIKKNKELSSAIHLFERLGSFRDLLGLAYLAMMLQGREKWKSTDPSLTREQRIRLLSGFHTISEICTNLSFRPPTYLHDSDCENHENCQKIWGNIWEDVITWNIGYFGPRCQFAPPPVQNDLIGKMSMTIVVFECILDHDCILYPWPDDNNCLPSAIQATTVMFCDLEEQLANFFSDVE